MTDRLADALAVIDALGGPDPAAMADAQAHLDQLTKPPGSLGRLEELVVRLAGITGRPDAPLDRRHIVVFAADHGVAVRGVSAYPAAVTPMMVANFVAGGAAINVLARQVGARISRRRCRRRRGPSGHGTGSRRGTAGPRTRRERHRGPLGRAGDDRPADPSSDRGGPAHGRAARASWRRRHRHRRDGHRQHDRGGGARGSAHRRTRRAHDGPRDRARRRRVAAQGRGGRGGRRAPRAHVGHRGARARWPISVASRSPASWVSSWAAPRRASPSCSTAISPGPRRSSPSELAPGLAERLLAGHRSVEPGHRIVLDRLGLKPILDLDLRLGEGTGAALAMQVLASAVAIRDGMATFASAGVPDRA